MGAGLILGFRDLPKPGLLHEIEEQDNGARPSHSILCAQVLQATINLCPSKCGHAAEHFVGFEEAVIANSSAS